MRFIFGSVVLRVRVLAAAAHSKVTRAARPNQCGFVGASRDAGVSGTGAASAMQNPLSGERQGRRRADHVLQRAAPEFRSLCVDGIGCGSLPWARTNSWLSLHR